MPLKMKQNHDGFGKIRELVQSDDCKYPDCLIFTNVDDAIKFASKLPFNVLLSKLPSGRILVIRFMEGHSF